MGGRGGLDCPYAEKCRKTEKERTVRLDREHTAMRVKLYTISTPSTEQTKRVGLEIMPVSVGCDLCKFHNNRKHLREAA